jgi:hypothetical protein
MIQSRLGWGRVRGIAMLLSVAFLGLIVVPNHTGAQTSPVQSRKLTRELAIMEKIIDQMLLDSQNFLVYSQPETRGLYLDEFGVLFSFQASLLNRNQNDNKFDFNFNDFEVKDNGDQIVIQKRDKNKDKDKDDKDDEEAEDPEDDEATESRLKRTWEKSQKSREAKLYNQGKAEILDILLDYGDSIESVRDNQWLAIAAYLKGSSYFLDNRISRLVLKAKMSDIRAFGAGKISRESMLSKVVEEEY